MAKMRDDAECYAPSDASVTGQSKKLELELDKQQQTSPSPQQPAKTRTSKNPDPMKYGFNIGGMFILTYKKLGRGSDYRIDGADRGALRSLYQTFRPGETKLVQRCIELYLYDTSKFLQEMRHKLEYLPKHINKYIAQVKQQQKPEAPREQESNDPDPYELESANGSGADARPEAGDAGAGSDAVSPGLGKARDGAA